MRLSQHQERPAVVAVDKRRVHQGATSELPPLAAPAARGCLFMVATLTASRGPHVATPAWRGAARSTPDLYRPCRQDPLRSPLVAPVPGAPPCMRQRPCFVVGDWQGAPRRVLAKQRRAGSVTFPWVDVGFTPGPQAVQCTAQGTAIQPPRWRWFGNVWVTLKVTLRPSSAAAFRFMNNSNFIGICTGRPAGLAPWWPIECKTDHSEVT